MIFSIIDREMMSQALKLAAKGRFTTSPNPTVGCVIVADGKIAGQGFTRPAGGNHAEIEALQNAGDTDIAGATAYVSLEPCSHQGKTGPCVEALIAAGIGRVVIACEDPNPQVAGSGIEKLQAAGIQVESGLLEDQARDINRGFIKRHEQGTPWVLVKMAASLDGRTAMASGQSQWITTPPARQDVQRLRAGSCAIITGIGTQLMDDPSLTVRITHEELGVEDSLQQPLRVVVDSKCQMAATARMFEQPGPTLIATLDGESQREKSQALIDAGAEVVFLPAIGEHIDLQALSVKDMRMIGEDIRVTLYPDKDY
ncbi:bifunctional diaminohydroxyphosphoribosylaminopyrimidine deaminase/5-amino-6-(5-phosphoribosylamino)uracil reductase RibD [bacterium]|nr:bifunctional diaminohydroxyphosphoribosylaminopyrimidine deaminase/5-amino-6-(5-phosphoribosylamino)uracil reductase RibD [bacterium]